MLWTQYFYILVVVLELINISNGRPLSIQPPSSNSFWFRSIEGTKSVERRDTRSITDDNLNFEEVIFPDSSEWEPEPIRRLDNTPNCSSNDTFCENVEFYPYQHVKIILQKLSTRSKFFFGVDEELLEVDERLGTSPEENFVCTAVQRLIFPKIARNKNNQWKYVVNQDKEDGFVQGIRIETCRNHGGPCDLLEVPHGFTASCKQKYIYRRMLALTDEGSPAVDTFRLPSACCCSYKRDLEFLTRFGGQMSPAKVQRFRTELEVKS